MKERSIMVSQSKAVDLQRKLRFDRTKFNIRMVPFRDDEDAAMISFLADEQYYNEVKNFVKNIVC